MGAGYLCDLPCSAGKAKLYIPQFLLREPYVLWTASNGLLSKW
jgi:hypothetical protein